MESKGVATKCAEVEEVFDVLIPSVNSYKPRFFTDINRGMEGNYRHQCVRLNTNLAARNMKASASKLTKHS